MANDLLNELNRNLKSAEEVGDAEWTKRLKKRIAQLEKDDAPKPEPAKPVNPTVSNLAAPNKGKN